MRVVVCSPQPASSSTAPLKTDRHSWFFLGKLFIETLRISAFTLGGGFVIIGFLQDRFVNELHWLETEEMLNYVSIAQSSPGPIAINTAVLIGYKLAGLKGALTTVLGTSIPPLLIITIIAYFFDYVQGNPWFESFFYGARFAVAAIILNVTINTAKAIKKTSGYLGLALGTLAAFAIVLYSKSVVYIIACGALIGWLFFRPRAEEIGREALSLEKKKPPTP